ncbi:hypothetical protein SAMN04489761_1704 [Tenacibaculum sp. MAR_2009_124]|uniref:hypothetical protein n=1 Tax=Tenacibaculum sp. MAR_2009_124 TaxID=1250059 RepID=UPI000895EA8B|nr:hypothetical protein [Tenacibaculum sp. MAR_2009_124]SEB76574.1 hypothetical protein SAMN04489761_1704 [Tenacibaculum sp. MAR_2009_124]
MRLLKNTIAILFAGIILFSSCRTEETITIDPPITDAITPFSKAAVLLERTALKDGSKDNIIDQANCITIDLPITVIANGVELVISDDTGYQDIEDIFDEFTDDNDTITIAFPIKIILIDYTVIEVNNIEELENFKQDCNGENENDGDIECIDFVYPVGASLFNASNEQIGTVSITNDEMLHNFIKDIDENTIVTLDFPIKLKKANGEYVYASNIDDLERLIEAATYDCDEDDDNDYNDDDCDDCTQEDVKNFFREFQELKVYTLERQGNDLQEQYQNHIFWFKEDGTLKVFINNDHLYGTWELSGTGNDITLTIAINDLPDFNENWKVHEITRESDEYEIDLRNGDDQLIFAKNI